MNRRGLLLTALGTLAGAFGLQLVKPASVLADSGLAGQLGRDTVYSVAAAEVAIQEIIPRGVSTADLFVSPSAEVSASLAGLLVVKDEAEMDAFLQKMADVILEHKRRGK